MKTSILNKLSPEIREFVINTEARIRELEEQKSEINNALLIF
jgi:hypothetical protein